jgi:hypothetical protein
MEFEANEAIRKHLPVQVKVFQPGDPELEKVSFLYQTFLLTKQQSILFYELSMVSLLKSKFLKYFFCVCNCLKNLE